MFQRLNSFINILHFQIRGAKIFLKQRFYLIIWFYLYYHDSPANQETTTGNFSEVCLIEDNIAAEDGKDNIAAEDGKDALGRDGHRLLNEHNFWKRTKFFVEKGVAQ